MTNPKVLLVGDLNEFSKGYAEARAMRVLGLDVKALSHTIIDGAERGHSEFSLGYRIAHKLGYELDTVGINRSLLAAAREFEAAAAADADVEHWRWMWEANVMGTLHVTKALLPKLIPDTRLHIGLLFGLLAAVAVGVLLPTTGWPALLSGALVVLQMVFSLAVEPMYQPIQTKGWGALRKSYAWQRWDRSVPSDARREAAAVLRAELEDSSGEVFALQRPWWSVLAGGRGHVGSMGITDVVEEDRREIQGALVEDLRAQRYARVWTEGDPPRWMLRGLRGYCLHRRLHGGQRVRPMSGYMSEAGMVTPYRADQLEFAPCSR